MTKFLIMSDLHNEFGAPFDCPKDVNFDIAIFAGDIWKPITRSIEWLARQRDDNLGGKPVVFVAGNHEFYGDEMVGAREAGWERAQQLGIHFLDPEAVVIDGVRIIGATLWTDYNLYNRPVYARRTALRKMNDFKRIKVVIDGKKDTVRPHYIQGLHQADRAFIKGELAIPHDGPTVVVTHHAPHPQSIVPMFREDELSPCYASDLSDIIEKHQPALWVHGHDHNHHLYRVGQTMIFSNPAGYPHPFNGSRECKNFDPRYVVEI